LFSHPSDQFIAEATKKLLNVRAVLDLDAQKTMERHSISRLFDGLPDKEVRKELAAACLEQLLHLAFASESRNLETRFTENALDQGFADSSFETTHIHSHDRVVSKNRTGLQHTKNQ